ncbi:hypothetical protein V5F38_03690 [Xanthobacter sp. V0B-10]|uniref:hypothetical protein n=1 Tax=Xanthobacter albus TaxID=3119929 RepID=UPI0037269FA7
MKKLLLACAALGAMSLPALADQTAADNCAVALDANGQAIYAATVVQAATAPTSDLRGLVTTVTKQLVSAGAVPMGSAREAAEAAGACLAKLH